MSTVFFWWDIRPEKDREYKDFISNDYLPQLAKLNLNVTDGWLKLAGEGPQMMYLAETDDYAIAKNALESREFRATETRLQTYVENYSKHVARRDTKKH